jgi:hypothetical protein
VFLADGSDHVGGAKAAGFLKGTNLSVDTLRTIWSVVDSGNKGKVDKVQFTRIIRLVSIAKSPIYAGSVPTMERYYKTAKDTFPMPPLTTSADAPAAAPASAPVAAPAPAASPEWIPSAQEASIMNAWFDKLDIERSGYVLGARAAGFLQNCALSREALRPMWGLVDTTGAGRINRAQFYKIIRLVALGSFPAYAGRPATMELYHSTAQESIPLPTFTAVGHDATSHAAHAPAAPVAGLQPAPYYPQQYPGHPSMPPSPNHQAYGYQYGAPPAAPVNQHPGQVPAETEEFSDFASANPAEPSAADDEFSDFSAAPTASTVPAPTFANVLPTSQVAAAPEDDFSDFASAAPVPAPAVSAVSAPPARLSIDDAFSGMMSPPQPSNVPTISFGDEHEDDDMGEFVSADAVESKVAPSNDDAFMVNVEIANDAQTAFDMIIIGSPYSTSTVGSGLANEGAVNISATSSEAPPPSNLLAVSVDSNDSGHFHQVSNPLSMSSLSSDAHGHSHQMSPFQSARIDPPAPEPVSGIAAPGGMLNTNSRMHFLDALAELDLQATNEEWDDFAAASVSSSNAVKGGDWSEPSTIPSTMNNTPALTMDAENALQNPFDAMGYANSPVKSLGKESTGSSTVFDWDEGEDVWHAPAQDTVAPAAPVTVDPVSNIASSNSTSNNAISSMFGELDVASNNSTGNNAISSTFGELDAQSGGVGSETASSVDWTDAASMVVEPARSNLSSRIGASAASNNSNDMFFESSFDEGDFGGFESASSHPSQPAQSVSLDTNVGVAASGSDAFASFDTGDDDFGDFETSTHASSLAPTPSAPTPSVPPVPAPSMTSNTSLLDFDLLDPVPHPPAAAKTATGSSSSVSTSMLDFDDFGFTSPPAPAPSSASFDPFGPVPTSSNSHTSTEFDAFGSAGPVKSIASKKPPANDPLNSPKKRSSTKVVALSSEELIEMSQTLFEKNLFEEAYLACMQAETRATIDRLSEEKREAVENDDLETAIRMKNAISAESAALSSPEQEASWVSAANNQGLTGDALEDMVDLILTLNPKIGGRCKTRFVDCAPSLEDDKPVLERALFAMLAKRSMRLITATLTTHVEFPDHWARILSSVSSNLTVASDRLESFKQLSKADQKEVMLNDKMKNFLVGTNLIAHVGLWVATSCTESLVNEKQAAQVASSAVAVVKTISEVWPAESEVVLRNDEVCVFLYCVFRRCWHCCHRAKNYQS